MVDVVAVVGSSDGLGVEKKTSKERQRENKVKWEREGEG